jgi:hypothetical protein
MRTIICTAMIAVTLALASQARAASAEKYFQACWNLGHDITMSVLNTDDRKSVGYCEGVIDAIQWDSPGEICTHGAIHGRLYAAVADYMRAHIEQLGEKELPEVAWLALTEAFPCRKK